MGFKLLTDSDAEIPFPWVQELDLDFLRMPYSMDGQVIDYDLGEKIDIPAFYEELRKGKVPTTMMRNAAEIRDFFEPYVRGGQDVLYLGFSSALSGNFNCALQAAEELRAEYPDRKLIMVDTLSISMSQGQIVRRAAELRDQGKSMEEVAAWVEENKLRSNAYFTVNDLFHLKRGGRVSGATALMGTVLSIKPLLKENGAGQLVQDGKVQSRRKALAALLDRFLERAEDLENEEVHLMHGDCLEEAQLLEKMLRAKCNPGSVRIHLVGPVIASHTGPGVMGIVFWGKARE
jgi:DegV family protein with EDD domain